MGSGALNGRKCPSESLHLRIFVLSKFQRRTFAQLIDHPGSSARILRSAFGIEGTWGFREGPVGLILQLYPDLRSDLRSCVAFFEILPDRFGNLFVQLSWQKVKWLPER